jgi:hypothetical protein
MKLIYKCLLYIILFIPIVYIFTWIHELGHVLGAVLSGNESYKIVINILSGGEAHMIYHNHYGAWAVFIMGSLLTLILIVPFLVYTFKKKNIWVLSIVYMIIAKEIFYWGVSPLINYGDAYLLIQWAKWCNLNILIIIIKILSFMFFIIVVCLYILVFYYSCKWTIIKNNNKIKNDY